MRKLTSLLALGAVAVGLCAVVAPQSASAAVGPGEDRQNTAVAPSWYVYTGLTADQVATTLSTNNARLTDLNVDVSSGTPKYTVTEVGNSGAYASGWWWYYNATPEQVVSLSTANNARPIVTNCYLVSGATRCAVVMVANTGANAESWSFYYGTRSFIDAKVNPAANRLVSLSRIQGSSNYAAVFGSNTGTDAVNWHYFYGQTTAQISSELSTYNARIVDLDENNDTGTYNVVMYANTTRWYWYVGSDLTALVNQAVQQGQRIFDVTRFVQSGATKYAIVSTRNTGDLTEKLYNILAPTIDSGNFGFELKQLNGGDLASLQSTKQFEPASALKVLYHYVSIRNEQAGTTLDSTPITYHYNPADPTNGGICPDSYANTATTTLKNADTLMMQNSDNRMTRGILEKYGKAAMLAQASALGMTSTTINHNIGCPTAATHNRTTLSDLDKVYEAYQNRTDINTGKWHSQFRQRMLNDVNNPSAVNSLCTVVHQEATALGKPSALADRFCLKITWMAKGGSYQYGGSLPWTISWANGSLTSLPFKTSSGANLYRYYYYGDFVDNTTINSTAEQDAIANARNTAYLEALRPSIDSALQTW
jgi:uncharacterized protein YodC (DUF2158 family)